MLNVTERAREQFRMAIPDITDGPDQTLRLGPTPQGQLGVFPDVEQPGDQLVEHEGTVVLLVGPEVAEALAGKTLDVEETEEGRRFVLKR